MTENTRQQEKNGKKEKTQKKSGIFWKGYLIFCVLLLLFWGVLVWHVRRSLAEYEAAQPYHLAEQAAQEIQAGRTDLFAKVDWESSRFESSDEGQGAFLDSIAGKTITYEKDNGFYETASAAYLLYADGVRIGTVVLREISTEPMLLLLTKGQWEIAEIRPVFEVSEKQVTIKAPDGFQVFVNDIALDERERVGEPVAMEQFGYAANYVDVPCLVEYRVSGLLRDPDVRICDARGQEVEYSRSGDGNDSVFLADNFAVSEMEDDLAAMALENAKNYSNFFSRDLPGCTASVAPLKYMFPEDSYYLELAETYRREDMWMYNAHNAPVFVNEQVANYTEYTEDLFSCEVYFEKQMQLTKYSGDRVDVTHSKFYYGRIDGEWKILDIQTILEQDD